jgi:hypothetical protein
MFRRLKTRNLKGPLFHDAAGGGTRRTAAGTAALLWLAGERDVNEPCFELELQRSFA